MDIGPIAPNPTTDALHPGCAGYCEPQALFIDSAHVTWLRPGFILWPGPTGTARMRVTVEWDGPHITAPMNMEAEHVHDAIGTGAVLVAQLEFAVAESVVGAMKRPPVDRSWMTFESIR